MVGDVRVKVVVEVAGVHIKVVVVSDVRVVVGVRIGVHVMSALSLLLSSLSSGLFFVQRFVVNVVELCAVVTSI